MDNKFNLEFHRKWIETLRSGKYEQGFAALRTLGDGYCCLGVAACLLGATWERVPSTCNYRALFPDGSSGTACLSEDYDNLLGIGRTPNHPALSYALMNFNDKGWSFNDIADALEVMVP